MNPVEVSLQRIREIEEENNKGNKPPLSTDQEVQDLSQSFSVGHSDIDDQPQQPPKNKNKKRRKRKARSQ